MVNRWLNSPLNTSDLFEVSDYLNSIGHPVPIDWIAKCEADGLLLNYSPIEDMYD